MTNPQPVAPTPPSYSVGALEGAAVSFIGAFAGAMAVVAPLGWSPICAGLDRDSVEWFFFGCWYGEPEKDGQPEDHATQADDP